MTLIARLMLILLLPVPTLLFGCNQAVEPEGTILAPGLTAAIVQSSAPNVVPLLPTRWDHKTYTAHEWGTFTSVQSSVGRTLDGVHREEEPLPGFVHRRDLGAGFGKGMEMLPEAVNQKMETPVIYFYSTERREVSATVDFPNGIISEYYPSPVAFEPPKWEMTALAGGRMTWNIELHPERKADAPTVDPADIWAPSRRTEATTLSVGSEEESFIFYRGVGRFVVPLRVTATDTHLTLHNDSAQRVPSTFLLNVTADGGAVHTGGAIEPHSSITVAIPDPTSVPSLEDYVDDAANRVAAAVQSTGLFVDEARAMVDTWRHSYFHSRGLRVLYVLPDVWTDALLPLTIEPKPEVVERAMVGRIEVLTPSEEQRVVKLIFDHYRHNPDAPGYDRYLPPSLVIDRFAEPKIRRALELVQTAEEKAIILQMLELLADPAYF